jgi:hypothetical protein
LGASENNRELRTIWFRTPWSERLAAGISGDPTATGSCLSTDLPANA